MDRSLPKRSKGRRKLRRGVRHDQKFSAYLSFELNATVCVGCFVVLYVLVLLCLLPMLDDMNQVSDGVPTSPLEGAHFPHAPGEEEIIEAEERFVRAASAGQEKIVHAASAGQEKIGQAASALRAKIQKIRRGQGVSDESLLNAAKAEFEVLRAQKRGSVEKRAAKDLDAAAVKKDSQSLRKKSAASEKKDRTGFVVLGMHRSGTSMLSGLLVTGMGYNVGGPLIGPASDNEKGFFERIDVVLQNDEFLKAQSMGWSYNVVNYDAKKALAHKESGKIPFEEGEKGLDFLNDPSNAPWLQKDPRMCIALRTWLSLLNTEPAVLYTYRHPFEVALSLKKRENFTLEHGLRLWLVYNIAALKNSAGLCRVLSSNEALLAHPIIEVQRISDELTKCGIPRPPRRLTQELVDKFVDQKLQHNKEKRKQAETGRKVLEEHNGCVIKDYDSDLKEGTQELQWESRLYLKAMKMHCDLQSGEAYKDGYEFPDLSA